MDNSKYRKRYSRIDYIIGKLDPIDSELESDVILNNALNALKDRITKTQLIKSINISIDRWISMVTIESYARTADLAYNINKLYYLSLVFTVSLPPSLKY